MNRLLIRQFCQFTGQRDDQIVRFLVERLICQLGQDRHNPGRAVAICRPLNRHGHSGQFLKIAVGFDRHGCSPHPLFRLAVPRMIQGNGRGSIVQFFTLFISRKILMVEIQS